ncbi:hypothetical protein BDR03DRAFT_963284 [Suillus americanus]|nr:hypothetical protein BDR03DRAFT_963284 [Suillus americanus]
MCPIQSKARVCIVNEDHKAYSTMTIKHRSTYHPMILNHNPSPGHLACSNHPCHLHLQNHTPHHPENTGPQMPYATPCSG